MLFSAFPGTHDSAADLSRAQKVVRGVLKLKAAAPFSRPVNAEEVPGYALAVQNPMDLGTVLEKLKTGEYTSLGRDPSRADCIGSNLLLSPSHCKGICSSVGRVGGQHFMAVFADAGLTSL